MKNSILILLFFLLAFNASARDLDAPLITCLEVHEAGDVTIYWQSLDTTAIEFKIFYSTDNLNWIQAGSVESQNLNLQYNHASAQANNQIYYYYITAVYAATPNIEIDSDVFRTIFLVVDNSTAGVATLFWNSVKDPLPDGSSQFYNIYGSTYESGTPVSWYLISDEVQNTLFNYTIPNGLCYDSINFKIEIGSSHGCSSISNITGNWFSEQILPEKPTLDSVSIINNKDIIIGWDDISSPDVAGIIIYRKVDISWPDSTSITIPYSNYYIDTTRFPCSVKNIQYAIASIDSCGNKSPKTEVTAQRPIFFNPLTYDICSKTISLTWESYINSTPELDKYQIWVSKNDADYELYDEVNGDELSYLLTNVESLTTYSIFVRAKYGSYSSTSCIRSITTENYIEPEFLYLANTSVLMDNTIELTIEVDLVPDSCLWQIYRSDVSTTSYSIIDTLLRSQIVSTPYSYFDLTADGSLGYYNYYVSVYDSCNMLSIESNNQKTIFLEGSVVSNNENLLQWNDFEGFESGVGMYYVYRRINDESAETLIDSVNFGINQYIDDLSMIDVSAIKLTYRIQAYESSLNSFGFREKSYSNHIDLFRETELYMPNAFNPEGIDKIFKPISVGFGGSDYLFQIYNRWGQLIFETNDPSQGWDGTYKGNYSPRGTYIYRLVYTGVFNNIVKKQGPVTLIR